MLSNVIAYVMQLKFLDGYRAKLGGAGLILLGLGSLVSGATGVYDTAMTPEAALVIVANGLGILGIRGKQPT